MDARAAYIAPADAGAYCAETGGRGVAVPDHEPLYALVHEERECAVLGCGEGGVCCVLGVGEGLGDLEV